MRRRRKAEDVAEASGEPPVELEPPPKSTERTTKYPMPGIPWGNLVEDTLEVKDPAGVAKRLRGELQLGEGRTDYGAVLEALDRSARNYDDAGRLFRAARVEEERYKLECAERLEVMRSTALQRLMEEYHAKIRRSPTNDDISDRIIKTWPDEYVAIQSRLAELNQAVKSLETLVNAWSSRSADLRIIADKIRR